MFAGGDNQLFGIITIEVALERPLILDFVGLPGFELIERIDVARAGAGVATIQNHREMGMVGRHFGKQDRQFFIRQIIIAAFLAAVKTHQALVPAVGIVFFKFFGRRPTRAVAAVLKHGYVMRLRFAKMFAKLLDNIAARGLFILEHDGFEVGEIVLQIIVKAVDVIDAAGELADLVRIFIDAHQQGVDFFGHSQFSSL
ncbi:MAG: hypothetical protein ALAOOOJD_02935 [bacterium]|nr:hypothetical protein [bacterium]